MSEEELRELSPEKLFAELESVVVLMTLSLNHPDSESSGYKEKVEKYKCLKRELLRRLEEGRQARDQLERILKKGIAIIEKDFGEGGDQI